MKATTKTKRNRNTGLRHSEITPYGGKWVLSYQYHGSGQIFSRNFLSLSEAQAEMDKLRGLSK